MPPQVPSDALPTPRAPEIAPAKGKPYRESHIIHFALLLAITALGGALRFAWLDRPSIWGDEAATFARVSGNFAELMSRLQGAGFAPIHYELYWWIGQHTTLTPFMMRLIPAITGTLLIPAMYWLAAQLLGRRAALLTALLTATSAYLLNYSRDAKMYSPFWFFAVLNVASLLWWLRVRTPTSWCLWLTSGVAMVGFDALGWITVVIELFIVLTTQRANWLSLPRLLLLLISSASVWLLSIGVPVFIVLLKAHALCGHPKVIALTLIVVAIVRVLCLLLGLSLKARSQTAEEHPSPLALRGNPSTIPAEATPDAPLPAHDPDLPISQRSTTPTTSSRLPAILLLPSERSLARPWIARRTAAFRWPPLILFVFGLLIMFAGPFGYYYDFNRFLERVDERGWGGTGIDWVDRYEFGRTGPALVGFTASAYLTSWEWPRATDVQGVAPRTFRLLSTSVLCIAATLALGLLPWPWSRKLHPNSTLGGWRTALWLILWLTVPPYAFYCVSIKDHAGPYTWLLTARDFLGTSPWWITAAIALLAITWLWIAGATWQQRLLRLCQFLAILSVTLLIAQGFYVLYPKIDTALSAQSQGWREHGSVWMPRYVAVILPAVFIIVTALLWRLPTRPLRWSAIALFVVVNLSVHGARVFAGSEPPSAIIAHDLLDTQKSDNADGPFRAYFESSLQMGAAEPGSFGLRSSVTRYYLTILSPPTTPPNENFWSMLHLRLRPGRYTWLSFSGFIINEVRRSPKLQTFVTWERLEPRQIDLTNKILDALEPDWRLASEQTFALRDHWRWIDIATLRRRVYVRTNPPQP